VLNVAEYNFVFKGRAIGVWKQKNIMNSILG